jgi:hypothetical protein
VERVPVAAERVAEEVVVVDQVEDLVAVAVARDQEQDGVQMDLTVVAFVCPAMK